MSLVWGQIVHPLTGYYIPHPGGALLATPLIQQGIFSPHTLPPIPSIVGLLVLPSGEPDLEPGNVFALVTNVPA